MTTRSEIVLTTSQIAAWREEDAKLERKRAEDERLEREINERNQRRKELRRKLDAASVFAEAVEEVVKAPLPPAANGHDLADQGDSAAVDLVENLRKTGDSLKVKQARQRLIDIGHEEKANQKNYIYGLLYRLVKSGKLIKRGTKYKAAPTSSPQGETGALGAPASHVTS